MKQCANHQSIGKHNGNHNEVSFHSDQNGSYKKEIKLENVTKDTEKRGHSRIVDENVILQCGHHRKQYCSSFKKKATRNKAVI